MRWRSGVTTAVSQQMEANIRSVQVKTVAAVHTVGAYREMFLRLRSPGQHLTPSSKVEAEQCDAI